MDSLQRPSAPSWYGKFRQDGDDELAKLVETAGDRSLQGYINEIRLYRDLRRRHELTRRLLDVSGGHCHSCEIQIDSVQSAALEHYRPKLFAGNTRKDRAYPRHYWWLIYEWENLQVLCPICNRNKASLFPVRHKRAAERALGTSLAEEGPLLLNPFDDDPIPHLDWTRSGQVAPLSERGKTTIEVYDLNRSALVENRRRIAKLVSQMVKSSALGPADSVEEKRHLIERTLADWNQPHKGMARALLDRQIGVKGTRRIARRRVVQPETSVPPSPDTRYQALWIEQVRLENFCLFADAEIRFPDPSASYEPWLAILGENGVGKSSFLKAVTLALADPDEARRLVPDTIEVFNRNTRRRKGVVEVTLSDGRSRRMLFDRDGGEFAFEGPKVRFPVIALGASRIGASAASDHGLPVAGAIDNIFDVVLPLVDAEGWLADTSRVSARDFASFGDSLKFLLDLNVGDDVTRREGKIHFRRGDSRTSLSQMSDGFRSVIGLTAHIMKHLAADTPVMSKAEGTVLLDEIELHLHPTWKIQIVRKLRELFPLVRFAITTHDPLCLHGLYENESYRFATNEAGDNIEITPVHIRPGMDVNDILTSGGFGLSTTLDRDTQDKVEDYSALLLQQDRLRLQEKRDLDADERQQMEELRGVLHARLGGFAASEAEKRTLVRAARQAIALKDDEQVETAGLKERIAKAFGRGENS